MNSHLMMMMNDYKWFVACSHSSRWKIDLRYIPLPHIVWSGFFSTCHISYPLVNGHFFPIIIHASLNGHYREKKFNLISICNGNVFVVLISSKLNLIKTRAEDCCCCGVNSVILNSFFYYFFSLLIFVQ